MRTTVAQHHRKLLYHDVTAPFSQTTVDVDYQMPDVCLGRHATEKVKTCCQFCSRKNRHREIQFSFWMSAISRLKERRSQYRPNHRPSHRLSHRPSHRLNHRPIHRLSHRIGHRLNYRRQLAYLLMPGHVSALITYKRSTLGPRITDIHSSTGRTRSRFSRIRIREAAVDSRSLALSVSACFKPRWTRWHGYQLENTSQLTSGSALPFDFVTTADPICASGHCRSHDRIRS